MMKNMTYRNLMIVIRKIMKKGYDFSTSERLAPTGSLSKSESA